MQIDIIDHNVSTTTNVFLVIANIINLFYNIPQMYKTYKCKSTKDFSSLFLLLRIIGNLIWVEYAIELNSMLMLTNNIVTVLSSLFIGFYKLNEILKKNNIKNNANNNIEPIFLDDIIIKTTIDDNNINDNNINDSNINDSNINDNNINDNEKLLK
jgi:MtN3 and saliva related transmembrane protein